MFSKKTEWKKKYDRDRRLKIKQKLTEGNLLKVKFKKLQKVNLKLRNNLRKALGGKIKVKSVFKSLKEKQRFYYILRKLNKKVLVKD